MHAASGLRRCCGNGTGGMVPSVGWSGGSACRPVGQRREVACGANLRGEPERRTCGANLWGEWCEHAGRASGSCAPRAWRRSRRRLHVTQRDGGRAPAARDRPCGIRLSVPPRNASGPPPHQHRGGYGRVSASSSTHFGIVDFRACPSGGGARGTAGGCHALQGEVAGSTVFARAGGGTRGTGGCSGVVRRPASRLPDHPLTSSRDRAAVPCCPVTVSMRGPTTGRWRHVSSHRLTVLHTPRVVLLPYATPGRSGGGSTSLEETRARHGHRAQRIR